jgi:FSR family fosmidomycin resistance protein-like MFS transporter
LFLFEEKDKISIGVLLLLIFSKFFICLVCQLLYILPDDKFDSVFKNLNFICCVFSRCSSGTLSLGDRFEGNTSFVSIWEPFRFFLPYANLFWTGILSVVIGIVIASAFSDFSICSRIDAGYDFWIIFGFAFGRFGVCALGYWLIRQV